jgi:hypothetical protein
MQDIEEQKVKLEQKKNRLIAEETRLRLKEQKMRTRHLIEIGGLVVKASLDHLPANTLYGALISLNDDLKNNDSIRSAWNVKGQTAFNKEKQDKTPVILKFETEPNSDIRDFIRSCVCIITASVMNGTALLIILKTSNQNSKHLLVNTILKL